MEGGEIKETEPKHGHFRFTKVEVIVCITFVAANAVLAFFQVMPQEISKYPPADKDLKQSFLTPILGKKRDAHDDQWQAFRSNLPIMLLVMFAWKYFIMVIAPKKLMHKWMTSFWLGLGLLVFTYRADIILYMTVILSWYFMTKLLYQTKIIVPLSWTLVIVILYLNQQFDHLRFISAWMEQFIPDSLQFFKNSQAPLLWTNILNMNFLRMLSFTMDCHWGYSDFQFRAHSQKCDECKKGDLCYRGRDLYKLPQMNIKNYLDYMLFAPTCLAGPPISFTSFFSFDQVPTKKSPPYLRTFFLIIFFEIYLHYYPVITPNPNQTLLQMALCSILFLYFISLKFTIIWRVGRMWSLLYGVDVIDNMGRCMFNNYGFEKFWRMWHKGFNHWLIRYMYIRLGGNRNFFSVLAVIVFVAFWHDHSIHIIVWALILVLFMIPELLVKAFFRKYYKHLYPQHWFKYLCAFVCSFYIQIICYCNLIGFGYGFDNFKIVLKQIQTEWHHFVYITILLSAACILMFYIREVERPRRND